jgi:hypothetical protein
LMSSSSGVMRKPSGDTSSADAAARSYAQFWENAWPGGDSAPVGIVAARAIICEDKDTAACGAANGRDGRPGWYCDRSAPPVKDRSKTTAFKVLRTIDGDTIEIEQDGKPVKVRLIGVDTPETVYPSKPVEAYGKEASWFTANLLKAALCAISLHTSSHTLHRSGCSNGAG